MSEQVNSVLELKINTPTGDTEGKIELPADIFAEPANIPLMHQVVVAQLAAARQGTHATKTRGEVSGGGAKPYRQKGTGRARQGSSRAPQFVGGGIAHGVLPANYIQRTPKKMKSAALKSALSDRVRNNAVFVISSLVNSDLPSTKAADKFLTKLVGAGKILLVITRDDLVTWKSVTNLQHVLPIVYDQLNTYDVLDSDSLVFTTSALTEFIKSISNSSSTKFLEDKAVK